MNICICGGAGYIGTALANKLAEAGENVKVIDTFMYGDNLHP